MWCVFCGFVFGYRALCHFVYKCEPAGFVLKRKCVFGVRLVFELRSTLGLSVFVPGWVRCTGLAGWIWVRA